MTDRDCRRHCAANVVLADQPKRPPALSRRHSGYYALILTGVVPVGRSLPPVVIVSIVTVARWTRHSTLHRSIIALRLVPILCIPVWDSPIASTVAVLGSGILFTLLGSGTIASSLALAAAIVIAVVATVWHALAQTVFFPAIEWTPVMFFKVRALALKWNRPFGRRQLHSHTLVKNSRGRSRRVLSGVAS